MLQQGGVFMGRSHCAACLDDCLGVFPHTGVLTFV